MKLVFIFAQVFGIIAWLLMVISYYRKNTNKILFVQLLAIVFYCLNYIFLGAYVGMIIIIFELIRDLAYYKSDKDKLIFMLSIPVYVILACFNYNNPIELIPILASLIEGYTFIKSKKVVVIGALLVYVMWIIYDLEVLSYTGAITDLIIVISNILIIVRYMKTNSHIDDFKIYNHYTITETFGKKMSTLDKETYSKKLCLNKEYQEKLYKESPESFSIIKYKSELSGYIIYLVINKERYEEIINSDNITTSYYNDEILKFSKTKDNYVIIDSIVLDEKYDGKKAIKLYDKVIKKYINEKVKEGYKIENIISFGVTKFEKNVLDSSILKNKKILSDNNNLYSYRKI